jgi:hypothetical protein
MHAHSQATSTGLSRSAASLLAAGALAVALSACGGTISTGSPSAAVADVTATPAPTPASSVTQAASPNASQAEGQARLMLLTDASELWVVDLNGVWARAGSVAGARAITRDGRQIALATASGVESRDMKAASSPGKTTAVEWGSDSTGAYPGAVDVSDGGAVAAGVVMDDAIQIVVAGAGSSKATAVSPAPSSPFAPSVAWLDASRLLVLSTDARQISRLAVVDTSAHTMQAFAGSEGVRTFSLSPDRKTVAVATQAGVYVALVADLPGGKTPAIAVPVADTDVAWALAMDATGSRLAVLTATPAADGSIGAAKEVVFELRSGTWTKLLDSPAPTAGVRGQVWLE